MFLSHTPSPLVAQDQRQGSRTLHSLQPIRVQSLRSCGGSVFVCSARSAGGVGGGGGGVFATPGLEIARFSPPAARGMCFLESLYLLNAVPALEPYDSRDVIPGLRSRYQDSGDACFRIAQEWVCGNVCSFVTHCWASGAGGTPARLAIEQRAS